MGIKFEKYCAYKKLCLQHIILPGEFASQVGMQLICLDHSSNPSFSEHPLGVGLIYAGSFRLIGLVRAGRGAHTSSKAMSALVIRLIASARRRSYLILPEKTAPALGMRNG